jgi:hypothetical protein
MKYKILKINLSKLLYSKYFKIFLFILILTFISSFLIFKGGIWWYVDGMFMPHDETSNKIMMAGGLNTFNTNIYSSYFGGGEELFSSQKILKVFSLYSLNYLFGSSAGQTIFLFSFFVSTFVISLLFFNAIKKNKTNYYISLFFTFNPWTLWLMNKSGVTFSYPALFLFMYGAIKFYKNRSWTSIFLCSISSYMMLLYVRTALMNIILLFIFTLYILFFANKRKTIFNKLKQSKLKLMGLFSGILLINSPKLTILPYFFNKSAPWLNQFSNQGYNWLNSQNYDILFIFGFKNINGIFSFLTNPLHIILSILLIIIIFWNLLIKEKINNFSGYFIVSYIICMFLQVFLLISNNLELLNTFYSKIFIFMGLNIPYGTFLMVQLFPILIFIFYKNQKGYITHILSFLIIIYLLLSTSLFLNQDNFELSKINESNLKNIDPEKDSKLLEINTLIFPQTDYILLQDFPYPINIRHVLSKNREFTSSNLRISNMEGTNLKNNWENYGNLIKIFNVKSFLLMKGENPSKKYPFFTTPGYYNYISYYKNIFSKINNNSDIILENENEYYSYFKFKNHQDYDFLLYSPGKIIKEFEINKVKNQEILNNPIIIGNEEIPNIDLNLQNNPRIEYKYNFFDSSTYYVHAFTKNINSSQYMIQLNRAYSSFWKIKEISKQEYESFTCQTNIIEYSLSNNSNCEYSKSLISAKDIKFIFRQEKEDVIHFKGNIIGNGWILEKKDKIEDQYYVITYETQGYYKILLFISLLTIISLIILSIYERFQYIKKKKGLLEQ